MTTEALILVAVSALLTAAANLLMRQGLVSAEGLSLAADGVRGVTLRLVRQPCFVTGVICYGLAAVVWFRVLSIENVSSSYPMFVGLTFALVTVGAVALFGESLSAVKLVGIMVILAGILLVSSA